MIINMLFEIIQIFFVLIAIIATYLIFQGIKEFSCSLSNSFESLVYFLVGEKNPDSTKKVD